ncbi:hypothetical protein [Peromfec virus RodF8_66]|uniref:Uncharacterized protein n=1 Tax=Peromfec virus RodF8_66 TaxID=2929388 RepID=A0A976R871_9VIRU|nr:hypothetical protein [Peromfec virus RodF8_66]
MRRRRGFRGRGRGRPFRLAGHYKRRRGRRMRSYGVSRGGIRM